MTWPVSRDMVDHLHTLDGYERGRNLFLGMLPDPARISGDGDPAAAIQDAPGEPDYLSGEDAIEALRVQIFCRGSDLTETDSMVRSIVRVFSEMDAPGNPDGDGEMARGTADAPDAEIGYSGFWTSIAPNYMGRDQTDRHMVTATMRAYRYRKEN